MTIYKLDDNFIFTGETKELGFKEGRPKGWVKANTSPPEGNFIKWESNSWVVLEEYPLPPITSEQINEERARRILSGVTVNIGEKNVAIQGRDEDKLNLTNLGLAAQSRIMAGDDTEFQFRDGDNVTHILRPQEMFDTWQASIAFVEAVYQASWMLKEMESIPQDYTDDKYWP
jgi:hypothetical protein